MAVFLSQLLRKICLATDMADMAFGHPA